MLRGPGGKPGGGRAVEISRPLLECEVPPMTSASAMIAVTPPAVEHDPGSLLDVGASAIAVPVWPGTDDGPRVGAGAGDLAGVLTVEAAEALRREDKTGKAGDVLRLPRSGDIPRGLPIGL